MVNSAEGKQKFIFTLKDREKKDENIYNLTTYNI